MRHPAPFLTAAAVASLLLTASLAACAPSAGASGASISDLLARTPDTAANGADAVTIVYGDLERVTVETGRERPSDLADAQEVTDWLFPLTGASRDGAPAERALQLAQSFSPASVSRLAEIQEELGWSVADVDQFIEVQAVPQYFLLATTDDLTAALDSAQGKAVDGIWGAEGEDFHIDLARTSPARPTGENIRTAHRDGLLAVSRATPPLVSWLDGDGDGDGDGATLADDPVLAPIAEVLDEADVYTATIVAGEDFSAVGALGPSATPEILESVQDLTLPLPFTAVGVGLTTAEDSATGTIVLHLPAEEAAADSLEAFTTALTTGTSLRTGRPIADVVRLIDAKAEGNLIVATVEVADSAPGALVDLLRSRDLPFVHS